MLLLMFILDWLIFLFLLLFFVGYTVFMVDLVFGGHDFATTRQGIRQVIGILAKFKKQDGVFYDLGSCRGNFIVGLLKFSPNLQAFGVDRSRLRNIFSKSLSAIFSRPASFLTGDIFTSDVSKADAVYIYLDQSLMLALEKKLQAELKSGSIVITNTQHLPSWQPAEIQITHPKKPEYEKMFIYIKD